MGQDVFVNKVSLEQSLIHLFTYSLWLGLSHNSGRVEQQQQRPKSLQCLRYLPQLVLYRLHKVWCRPWSKDPQLYSDQNMEEYQVYELWSPFYKFKEMKLWEFLERKH